MRWTFRCVAVAAKSTLDVSIRRFPQRYWKYLLTYIGFAITRHVVVIACCFVLYGMYQGISRSVGKALAADLVPQSVRASGLGWYTATTGLLGLIASIVAGQLWDRVGHPAVFFYGAAFAAVGVIALIGLVPAETRPSR
jgi:MFS family permease